MTLEAQIEYVVNQLPSNSPEAWKTFAQTCKECDQFTKEQPKFRDYLFDDTNRSLLTQFVALAQKGQNTKGTKSDVLATADAEKERKKKIALAKLKLTKTKIAIALALKN